MGDLGEGVAVGGAELPPKDGVEFELGEFFLPLHAFESIKFLEEHE